MIEEFERQVPAVFVTVKPDVLHCAYTVAFTNKSKNKNKFNFFLMCVIVISLLFNYGLITKIMFNFSENLA